MHRTTIEVDGATVSYLTAGDGTPVLLLHGTYWSRVWQPVVDRLGSRGLRPVAVDLPGCGRSDGELTLETAAVPALAAWVERFIDALAVEGPVDVAGHDIGGAVAQRLAVRGRHGVRRLALVNSVSYDSWPVPGVARFRDPEVVDATSTGQRHPEAARLGRGRHVPVRRVRRAARVRAARDHAAPAVRRRPHPDGEPPADRRRHAGRLLRGVSSMTWMARRSHSAG